MKPIGQYSYMGFTCPTLDVAYCSTCEAQMGYCHMGFNCHLSSFNLYGIIYDVAVGPCRGTILDYNFTLSDNVRTGSLVFFYALTSAHEEKALLRDWDIFSGL